jgi:lactoylglutathione lyase
MKFTAARKWAAGTVGAAVLVLGTAQITSATQVPEAANANAASKVAQDEFPREGQPNIYTFDIDRQSRFYQLLGFTELFRFTLPDGTIAFATLQKGPYYLTFAHTQVIRDNTGLRQIGPSLFKSSDVTVITADVDGAVARVRNAQGRVLLAPKEQPWGERQAYVADPDGNLVQISTHRGGH